MGATGGQGDHSYEYHHPVYIIIPPYIILCNIYLNVVFFTHNKYIGLSLPVPNFHPWLPMLIIKY